MRTYAQLSADDQAQARTLALAQITGDDTLLTDTTVRPKLDQLALQRARQSFYPDAGDRLVYITPNQ